MPPGGDYYSRDVYTSSAPDASSSSSSSASYSAASAQALQQKSLHKSCNPERFADSSLECDHKNPIVFALDVTGTEFDFVKQKKLEFFNNNIALFVFVY